MGPEATRGSEDRKSTDDSTRAGRFSPGQAVTPVITQPLTKGPLPPPTLEIHRQNPARKAEAGGSQAPVPLGQLSNLVRPWLNIQQDWGTAQSKRPGLHPSTENKNKPQERLLPLCFLDSEQAMKEDCALAGTLFLSPCLVPHSSVSIPWPVPSQGLFPEKQAGRLAGVAYGILPAETHRDAPFSSWLLFPPLGLRGHPVLPSRSHGPGEKPQGQSWLRAPTQTETPQRLSGARPEARRNSAFPCVTPTWYGDPSGCLSTDPSHFPQLHIPPAPKSCGQYPTEASAGSLHPLCPTRAALFPGTQAEL